MNLIPKRTKYRFKFRNKTRTKKVLNHDLRQKTGNQSVSKLCPKQSASFSSVRIDSALKSWLPYTSSQGLNQSVLDVSHQRSHDLLFGTYGFAFETHGTLSAKFIETVRLDIARALKKKAKVWLRLCCDTPVTARPVETRMGKGKGSIAEWQAKVRPGQIFVEFSGLSKAGSRDLLHNVLKKAPLILKLKS